MIREFEVQVHQGNGIAHRNLLPESAVGVRIMEYLGQEIHPGTLNLRSIGKDLPWDSMRPIDEETDPYLYAAWVESTPGALLRSPRTTQPKWLAEFVSDRFVPHSESRRLKLRVHCLE